MVAMFLKKKKYIAFVQGREVLECAVNPDIKHCLWAVYFSSSLSFPDRDYDCWVSFFPSRFARKPFNTGISGKKEEECDLQASKEAPPFDIDIAHGY